MGAGEAQAFVQRPGALMFLADAGLLAGAGFDFGPELSPGCHNLAYSILRACLPADVAREWRAWFAATVVGGALHGKGRYAREPRWEITVGDVRGLIECGEVFFELKSKKAKAKIAVLETSTVGGGGTLTIDEV